MRSPGELRRRLTATPNGVRRISTRTSGWYARGWWNDDHDPNFKGRKEQPAPAPPPQPVPPPSTGTKGYIVRKKGEAPATVISGKPMNEQRDAVVNLRKWRASPVQFVRDVFNAEPDIWQADFLRALAQNQRLALKACKGPGKTCALAWAIWWFMVCFAHPKILCTSITGDNLRDGLWTELAYWRNKSDMLKALFEWQTERIYAKDHQETWFASARTWSKQADKTQQANTLAGIHALNTMIVVDEVGDVPSGVVAAADASLATQGAGQVEVHKILIAGNPTQTEGPLWDACTKDRALWWVKEITGDPDAPDRAPRISKEWAKQQIDQWGADNPWVLVNVFGKFPPAQADKLLGPDHVRSSMERSSPQMRWADAPRVMGVDVARYGDDRSVLVRRQGDVIFPLRTWRNLDLMELSSQIAFEFGSWEADVIFVDETGVGGGVVDRLRQLGLPVIGVNFGSRPRDGRFADRRSEMWWLMADAVKKDLCLPGDGDLVVELTGPSFFFNQQGKLRIESKDDLKKRGLMSPDKADAIALTWAEPVGRLAQQSSREAQVRSEYNPYEEQRT